MAKGFKYTKEDVLSEMTEILNEAETSGVGAGAGAATAKPNVLELLKSKIGLNKARNERV